MIMHFIYYNNEFVYDNHRSYKDQQSRLNLFLVEQEGFFLSDPPAI